MSNEHREQAREMELPQCPFCGIQVVPNPMDATRTFHPLFARNCPLGTVALNWSIEQWSHRALSSRDTEIREVLEGLRNNHGCWCPGSEEYEFEAPFICGPSCHAARALWAKLQPGE